MLQNTMKHRMGLALAATPSSLASGWWQSRADGVAGLSRENRSQCFGISASSARFASFVSLFLCDQRERSAACGPA